MLPVPEYGELGSSILYLNLYLKIYRVWSDKVYIYIFRVLTKFERSNRRSIFFSQGCGGFFLEKKEFLLYRIAYRLVKRVISGR